MASIIYSGPMLYNPSMPTKRASVCSCASVVAISYYFKEMKHEPQGADKSCGHNEVFLEELWLPLEEEEELEKRKTHVLL